MRVLIWSTHPGDMLGQVITFLTHGPAQHAGFLRINGMVHEAYLPQVRDRKLMAEELPMVRIFRLEGMTPEYDAKFERLFDLMIEAGVKYSIADLFKYQLGMDMGGDMETICSRYDFACIGMVGGPALQPLMRCSEDQISPRDLLIAKPLIEETWADHPEAQIAT